MELRWRGIQMNESERALLIMVVVFVIGFTVMHFAI